LRDRLIQESSRKLGANSDGAVALMALSDHSSALLPSNQWLGFVVTAYLNSLFGTWPIISVECSGRESAARGDIGSFLTDDRRGTNLVDRQADFVQMLVSSNCRVGGQPGTAIT
jgi:hypothetical protein